MMLESAWLPLAADGVVAVLLIATLVYVARLNARLAALRADRGALAELIAGLQRACSQAEDAVAGLRLSANESGRTLETVVERSSALRDDLTFLIGKAETLADRLEGTLRPRAEPTPTKESAAPLSSSQRLATLLRQTANGERGEPVVRLRQEREEDAPEARTETRQSRSERELQRALLGRR